MTKVSYILIIIFQITTYVSVVFCQVFPVNTHILNGDRNKLINIVYLSEGYTQAEMEKFRQDVDKTTQKFFDCPPFSDYKEHFNVFSIEVPSKESGTTHPGTAADCPANYPTFFRNTYFNSTFDYAGIHRLLYARNYWGIYSVLQDNLPDWDAVFIIVNHTWYGGSGGEFATFSMDPLSSEVAIHEFGHSFADLADEYEVGNLPAREAPNTTSEARRSFIKWKSWINDSTPVPTPEDDIYSHVIGLFEGAVYHSIGWYRPKLNCKMRGLNIDFCEVCQEQIIKTIHKSSGTIRSFYPDVYDISILNRQNIRLRVEPFSSQVLDYWFQWYIDGRLKENANAPSILFNSQLLGNGKHEAKAIVLHQTNSVRNDPNHFLSDSVKWTIDISGVDSSIYTFYHYPNPFSESITFDFGLPYESHVLIKIYDILGQEVITLTDVEKKAGIYTVKWKPSISSGVYLYRVEICSKISNSTYNKTGKIILIR